MYVCMYACEKSMPTGKEEHTIVNTDFYPTPEVVSFIVYEQM